MSVALIRVIEGGLATTLQDLGRPNYRRYGVPPGGALDRAAHVAANRLVQNPANAATLEITMLGPMLQFETDALIALSGADLQAELSDSRKVPLNMSFFVRGGQILSFKSAASTNKSWGRCTYLAVHGGLAAPLIMGSRSTYLRGAFGGYQGVGRSLQPNDFLETENFSLPHLPSAAGRFTTPDQLPTYAENIRLQIIAGPYQENFDAAAMLTLLAQPYQLTAESDRMGFRLEGAQIKHCSPQTAEIESCATVWGAIQVPPNGQPIVLMADHQVTGGYPIIATIVSRDLPLLSQLLPGGTVSFYQ